MRREPARGERANLVGIYPQYRAAALLLLDALNKGLFEEARLADPKAGRVDDWQILTAGRLDAYQFKWSKYKDTITLNSLVQAKKGDEPIFQSLASGWLNRKVHYGDRQIVVHLATNSVPSTSPQAPATETTGNELGHRHFAAFIEGSWSRVHAREAPIPSVGEPWHDTWANIQTATKLGAQDFVEFVSSCELHLPFNTDFTAGLREREKLAWDSAVAELTEALMALPSQSSEIALREDDLARLTGYRKNHSPTQLHEFKLEDYVDEPLKKTADRLDDLLDRVDRGYICLKGSPGSGKSSTLTLALRRRSERVVRYYAFVPQGPNQTRGETENFLNHLVSELNRLGVRHSGKAPHKGDRHLLMERLREQLTDLGREFAESGRKSLILVDGLDHITREQHPVRSLLDDLPEPSVIPAGVVFVLGTQTSDLLGAGIRESLRKEGRIVPMAALSLLEIDRVLRKTNVLGKLSGVQRQKVIDLSGRHPLALRYLVRHLESCDSPMEIETALKGHFPFDDDIQHYYAHLWDQIENSGYKLIRMLGLLARLRKPADFEWLTRWADPESINQIKRRFSHYFEKSPSHLQFFHNSFRIFIIQRTSHDEEGESIPHADERFHAELAAHCVKSADDSQWRAEQFFHLAEAGRHVEALSFARPEWFRNQFLAMRPRDEIIADIRRGFDLAANTRCGLSAGRLVLAESEITSRFEALDFDRTAMLSLLVRGKQVARAIGWIHSGTSLRVSPDSALKLVHALQDVGEDAEAEKLFNLIEPLSVSSAASLTSGVRSQRKALVQWANAAVSFVPIDEILAVIRRFEFSATSHWDRNQANPPPIDQVAERAATLANLAIRFETSGREELSERISGEFRWSEVPDLFLLEYLLICLEKDDGPIEEIMRMESVAPNSMRLRIAELLANLGHKKEVVQIFRSLEVPKLSFGATVGHEVEEERMSRTWLRIAFFLGERVPEDTLYETGLSDFSRTVITAVHRRIAALHASAWSDSPARVENVSKTIGEVFEILQRQHSNRAFAPDFYHEKPRIMEALVDACVDFGRDAIDLLSRALDSQWSHPVSTRHWNNGLRREVIVNLCEAGIEKKWARKWLSEIGGQIDDSAEVGSRVSEYVAQAKAWETAGEPIKALEAAQSGLQKSMGIGYNNGLQLSAWIKYLEHAWQDGSKPSADLISRIARTIVSLDGEVDGNAMGDAALQLVRMIFRMDPEAGLKTWAYLTKHGAISYSGALITVLETVMETGGNLEVPASVIGELLIPLLDGPDPAFLANALRKVHSEHGDEAARTFADLYARRADTHSAQSCRNAWWQGLRQACGILNLTLPERRSQPTNERCGYTNDSTDETVALICEADRPCLQLVRLKRSHDRQPIEPSGQRSHIDWEEVAGTLATELSARELGILLKLFRGESYFAARVGRALTRRGCELGMNRELWSYGDTLLKDLDKKGRRGYVSDADVAPVFSILLSSDKEAGLHALLNYLTHHQWLGPSFLPAFRDGLLQNEMDRRIFDSELAEHLGNLLQGSEGNAEELQLNFPDRPSLSGTRALVRLIFSLLDHPTRIIHHAARRIFVKLGSEAHPDWIDELETAFNGGTASSSLLGLLAEFTAGQLDSCRDILIKSLPTLFEHGDIEARRALLAVALKLRIEFPPNASGMEASTITPLALPRIDFDRLPLALRIIYDLVACTSRVTGIPIHNLYHRAEEILERAVPSRGKRLMTTKFETLGRLLAGAGLEYTFTHPDRILGYHVGFRLLAELHSAGTIDDCALPQIRRLFSRDDHSLVALDPVACPHLFSREVSAYNENAWSDDWLISAPDKPFQTAPQLNDGSIIAAYRHAFRIHTDHLPIEKHIGLLREGPSFASHTLDYESHFQEENQPRECLDYCDWQRSKDDDELFVLGGQSKDLPSPPWLAIHPEIARRLGWTPDTSGLFAWVDAHGARMAESRWWADGPPDSTDIHGNRFTATGWICTLSEGGWDAMRTLGELYFDSHCIRHRSK